MAFDPVQPFVLLDDARTGRAQLFTGLHEVVTAVALAELRPALVAVRALGGDRAGFLSFEAGYALDDLSAVPVAADIPLLWFGRFGQVDALDNAAVDAMLAAGPVQVGPAEPRIERAVYDTMLARVGALIAAGDVYQINATFAAKVAMRGHPLALYRRLRRAQAAPHGALIHTGRDWILSLSPELLFDLSGRTLTTRPMKGTAPRGGTAGDDDAAAAALAADPKNRAENLMIVDLLRNDLSRVAEPGSVAVPALFEVERYPTVLQMTSTVTATARAELDAIDVLTALFPCGSVTGAPKHRAMQVIGEVEAGPRGLYTGSIGMIRTDGDARFNVAIRTLVLEPGGARLGLGGGIVADSETESEWAEALAKAVFLTRRGTTPDLIETMRFEPGEGIVREQMHRNRLAESAIFLGLSMNSEDVGNALARATAGLGKAARVRLLVAASGAVAVSTGPLPVTAAEARVTLVPLPVAASDWRLRHKTSDRGFYDEARRTTGTFEVVFVRPDGRITEGSFTSVFVERDGLLLTPPLGDGLLPGILRASLIAEGRAVETPLSAADLAHGFLLGNSLRGLIRARLA